MLKPIEGKEGVFHQLGKYCMISKDDELRFETAFKDFDLAAETHGLEFVSNGEMGNMYTVKIE